MTILIAIAGGLGSGKSEAVEIIKKIHGSRKVCHLKISAPLYEIQELVQKHLNIEKNKDRAFLQILGTDWGRVKNPDIWINEFIKRVKKFKDIYDVIICDDLRFCNEYKELKERGFTLVRIERPFKDRFKSQGTGNIFHISEKELSKYPNENFDYFIENNSTYEDFEYLISEMFLDILERESKI